MINVSINSDATFQELERIVDENIKDIDKKLPLVKNELADKVKENIENNLYSGLDYTGKAVAPKKKGGRIFYESGELFSQVNNLNVSDFLSSIFIGDSRNKIAEYLQYGTEHMVARPFFGLDDNFGKVADNIIKKYFNIN